MGRKQERLVNLTICLLSTRRFLRKDEIKQAVENYRDLNTLNFERQFERDKNELRELGVPIEVSSVDKLFDDEPGYRIRRAAFELPPVDLTAEEATAVALAARAWQEATLADATASAIAKLRAAGADPDPERLAALAPSFAPGGGLGASGPALDAVWQAVLERRPVRFAYRGGQVRTLEPWLVAFRRGAWYVLGRDVDRGEERLFKVNRIAGTPALLGEPGAYEIPAGVDARAVLARVEPDSPDSVAVIAINADAAPELRRRGTRTDKPAPFPGFAVYEIGYAQGWDFATEVAAAGEDAVVLGPADLRERVVAHLAAIAGAAS